MRKRIISIFLVLMMMFSMFTSFAEETVIEINVEDAVTSANADTAAVDGIKDAIEMLWDQYKMADAAAKQIQDYLDVIKKFEKLHDKKEEGESLSFQENAEYKIYQQMFGDEPPKYTKQDMLDNYIKNRDFPKQSIYAEIKKLRDTRDSIPTSIELGVRGLYAQLLSLQNAIATQEDLLAINESRHNSLKLKFEAGTVAEYDLIVSGINLEIQKLEIEKIRNSFKILELNFKQLAKLDLAVEYVYEDTLNVEDIMVVEPIHNELDYYLGKALVNRAEIKSAQYDNVVKVSEEIIIKHYLINELYTDRVNAKLAVDETVDAMLSAEASVTQNIYDGYTEVISYWNDYEYNLEAYRVASDSYDDFALMYELGQIVNDDLSMIGFQLKIAEDNIETSIRNYHDAVYKLEKATGLGPAY